MSTGYGFTGQYSYASDFGLLYFNARWVDPVLGRFAQADTIVPAGVQGYDRYAFVNNNPVRYTDPSGHDPWYCDTASCERKYSNRFSGKSVEIPLIKETNSLSASDIEQDLRDEATRIKESRLTKDVTFIAGVIGGLPIALAECGPSISCFISVAIVSGAAGNALSEAVNDELTQTAEKYEEIATALNSAGDNPDVVNGKSVTVSMIPMPETGSLVTVDEHGYQTMNSDYNPQEYLLIMQGTNDSVILDSNQITYINQTFGGGLFP